MYRKGAQDKKRARQFAKLAKEITVAAKMGMPEPDKNPRLRSAIQAARQQNMPKDNIERAIKKADPAAGGADYFEIRYEGYGPGNVAVIVEALTDNKNRTASTVRSTFTKYGGNLGESGSVAFNFERIGYVEYPADVASGDEMFEAALEAGANDVETSEDIHEIETVPEDLNTVSAALEEKFGAPTASRLDWKPMNTIPVDAEKAEKFMTFVDILDDDDDIQRIITNVEISDEVMEKLG
jgi:YebC/PmpR family DNA-binding regulatory protein